MFFHSGAILALIALMNLARLRAPGAVTGKFMSLLERIGEFSFLRPVIGVLFYRPWVNRGFGLSM